MRDDQLLEALRKRYNAGEKLKYVFFWGHTPGKQGINASCFSQWYAAPFTAGSDLYPTAEHYMMAEKALLFGDHATRQEILRAPTPGAAKALGRKVSGFDEAAWNRHRYGIVCRANAAKFSHNEELRRYLLQTGDRVLVEASPVDTVWGIGMAKDDDNIENPILWRGLNLLGFALMQVRDDLKNNGCKQA